MLSTRPGREPPGRSSFVFDQPEMRPRANLAPKERCGGLAYHYLH